MNPCQDSILCRLLVTGLVGGGPAFIFRQNDVQKTLVANIGREQIPIFRSLGLEINICFSNFGRNWTSDNLYTT